MRKRLLSLLLIVAMLASMVVVGFGSLTAFAGYASDGYAEVLINDVDVDKSNHSSVSVEWRIKASQFISSYSVSCEGQTPASGQWKAGDWTVTSDFDITGWSLGKHTVTIYAQCAAQTPLGIVYSGGAKSTASINVYCGHNNGHTVTGSTVAATCTAGGYTNYSCNYCGATWTGNATEANPNNHTDARTESTVAPTCTAGGYTNYKCYGCGATWTGNPTEANPNNHDYSVFQKTVAPTCQAQGYDVYKCSRCSSTTNKNYTAKVGHNYSKFQRTVAPTCTAGGYDEYKCEWCSATTKKNTTQATGHNYQDTTVKTAATCSATGVMNTKCSLCNGTSTRTIPIDSTAHSWNSGTVTTQPTCTSTGVKTYTCAYNSSHTKTEPVAIDSTKHNWDNGKVTTEPTCTSTGVKTYTCTYNSEHKKTETVKALGHNYSSEVIAPTCTADGYTKHTCSRCGGTYNDTTVKATGHTLEGIPAVSATCTETGLTAGVKCSVCQTILTRQEVTPALGHAEVTDKAVAATCTATGLTEGKHCARCKEVLVAQQTVPALGHDYSVKQSTVAPTCQAGGYDIYKCSRCTDTTTKNPTGTVGHNYIVFQRTVSPTCTTGGYDVYKCQWCSATTQTNPTSALNHDFSVDTGVAQAATCSATGIMNTKCSRCDATSTREIEIDPDNHKYETVVTDPTCTEDGYTTYTCAWCGDSYEADTVDKLGHDFSVDTGVAQEATCSATGIMNTKCSRCDATSTREIAIDPDNHNLGDWEVVTPAGCETPGLKTKTCAWCKEVIESEVIEATGHTEVEIPAVSPSCTEVGYTAGVKCSVCKTVLVAPEEIPATGHTEGEFKVEIIDDVEKYVKRCIVCEDVLETKDIPEADYTAVNEAIGKAVSLIADDYYDFSEVTKAVNAVQTGLNETKQETVDGYANAINNAIADLDTIVSLFTVSRATKSKSGNVITLTSSVDAVNIAISPKLKNGDTVTFDNTSTAKFSSDGRFVSSKTVDDGLTLADGRHYTLKFVMKDSKLHAEDIYTKFVNTDSIVVDNDNHTIYMESNEKSSCIYISNYTSLKKPFEIVGRTADDTNRYRINKEADCKFEGTVLYNGTEYDLTVKFLPYFELKEEDLRLYHLNYVSIDNDNRVIVFNTDDNYTTCGIYTKNLNKIPVTVENGDLAGTTTRYTFNKPESKQITGKLTFKDVDFTFIINFIEVVKPTQVKYDIVGNHLIIRQFKNTEDTITVPATMTVNGVVYNVDIGKVVLEEAEDGYLDPVDGPFFGNTTLKSVTFRDGVGVEDNDAQYMFAGSDIQEVYNMPEGVTDMYACFYACPNLTTVDIIPSTVKEMGYCFAKCRKLTGDIKILAPNVTGIDNTSLSKAGVDGKPVFYATGSTFEKLSKASHSASAKIVQF